MSIKLGQQGADLVTGFSGTVIGQCDYLTGCSQVLLVPKVGGDGKIKNGEWFDIQRVVACNDDILELDNGETPGCDISPSARF